MSTLSGLVRKIRALVLDEKAERLTTSTKAHVLEILGSGTILMEINSSWRCCIITMCVIPSGVKGNNAGIPHNQVHTHFKQV